MENFEKIKEVINIGVIGCGYWGPNLIRNFNQLGLTNVSHVCDLSQKRLDSIKIMYPVIKTTKDYQDIVTSPDISAVVIAVPVSEHFRLAKEALLNNKHVLIEKPMTSNSNEAKELIRLAMERNKVLMVDHTFEYSEAIKKIKEIIESGELGKIFYIRAEWLNLGLLQPDVNVIWDLAPHMISIINYISNLKPLSLNARAEGFIRKEIPEIAQVQISLEDNVSAYLTFGWLEPRKTRTITIVGDKKLLVYDLPNSEEPIKIYNKNVKMISDQEGLHPRADYKYGEISSPYIKNIESLQTMSKEFIESIQELKNPQSDGRSGLKVLRVLEAIDKSIKNGGAEVFIEDD